MWRNLPNVNHIKVAINKLKEINWLYKDITDDSLDEAAKQVIEVVNNTSSTMLEKATKDDIASSQLNQTQVSIINYSGRSFGQ